MSLARASSRRLVPTGHSTVTFCLTKWTCGMARLLASRRSKGHRRTRVQGSKRDRRAERTAQDLARDLDLDDLRADARVSGARCRTRAGQIGAVVLAAGRSTRFRSARSKLAAPSSAGRVDHPVAARMRCAPPASRRSSWSWRPAPTSCARPAGRRCSSPCSTSRAAPATPCWRPRRRCTGSAAAFWCSMATCRCCAPRRCAA